MKNVFQRVIASVCMSLLPAVFMLNGSVFGDVVYDSLSSSVYSSIMAGNVGNTVTLGGNKRFVTQFTFSVGISSSYIGYTNDFIVRFYTPSAPDGYPGKLIWQSPPKTNVLMVGGTQSVTLDVPCVRVPNTFIYTVQQAGDGYFPLCTGPIAGSSPNYMWTSLTKYTSAFANHMQVRIEAENRPDAVLLGKIPHSGRVGIGGEDSYSMQFSMQLGGYWNLFGPSFYGVTEWDQGSYQQVNATDIPEAVCYLTNGVDESLHVLAEFGVSGNMESNTLVKSPGIAVGYPDFYGCLITDIGLQLNAIEISHTTPGWTYFDWDVVWEIWGIQKSGDINHDGKVDLLDFALFSAAWGSERGQAKWNVLCDLALPEDHHIGLPDLLDFCAFWDPFPYEGFLDDFETGDFSRYDWQRWGHAPWVIVSNTVFEGSYAARSGTITHNQQSVLEIEMEVKAGNISFYKKVSSESNWDFLIFLIDGVLRGVWSGEIGWSQETFPVAGGTHVFSWVYSKDGSISTGNDCAWIDIIRFE